MPEITPILYVFAISHYCEKARWALDYLGIDYELRYVAPGEHRDIAKRLGAPGTSVPYLAVGERVIQGSAAIINWAQSMPSANGRSLAAEPDRKSCAEIEKRVDDIAGFHVRRFYYSEAMVEHPAMVRPLFIQGLPLSKRMLIRLAWQKIRKIMIKRMDLGAEQGEDSRRIVEAELNWIGGFLADGRSYLLGEEFSRADVAAASLLAPLALPNEHPTYGSIEHPPRLATVVAEWNQQRTLQWVRQIYAKHR